MTDVLVACVGNIFAGDDGFGVEVARRLAGRPQPPGVRVVDFGIRGVDLTYALMDAPDVVVLVDAAQRGHAPGTVSVVELETSDTDEWIRDGGLISAHDLDPAKVLRLAAALGDPGGRRLLVACEPLDLGGEAGAMGLSPPIEAAVEPAVATVERLVAELITTQSAKGGDA